MSETELYNSLETARHDLENHIGEFGDDSCLKNAIEVLRDKRVQAAFVKHIGNSEDFRDLTCHGFGRDGIEIVFRFQCRAPRICILAPAFAVQYQFMTHTVEQIIDPYLGKRNFTDE
jgi:hypothetical protein